MKKLSRNNLTVSSKGIFRSRKSEKDIQYKGHKN